MKNKNKIIVLDKLLTAKLVKDVLAVVKAKGFRYGWRSDINIRFSHWNLAFSQKGVPLGNRTGIKEELPPEVLRLWERIAPFVIKGPSVLMRAYCNAHTYGTEGYVHTDSKFRNDVTAIIYLNRDWELNWAGETVLFEKGEIIKAVLPKWKRVLIFPSNIKHAARGVSRFCPEARMVLVFKARPQ